MYETIPSLPRLTVAIISRALDIKLGKRILTVRLPGSPDTKILNTCFFVNNDVRPNICELEPGERDHADDPAPALIDASGCFRNSDNKIAQSCNALINDLEPGYLGFCDWGPYIWCLYALALSNRTRAAVILPAGILNVAEQARTILLREGLIERVVYFMHNGPEGQQMCALIVLSTENRSVTFHNAYIPNRSLNSIHTSANSCLPLSVRPDWTEVALGPYRNFSIETILIETRDLLQHHAPLSWGKISLVNITQNYSATLGDSFVRVVPFMPRESTISNDIEAVKVRRISSQDFRNGNLLPRDVAENATEPDSEPVKVDPELLKRYELRPGDIIMPRMLGRYGASNLLVVGVDDAKQHLVASHNTTAIRPAIQTMTDEERTVYSEMVAAYLTSGHGAKIMQVLFENQLSRAIRPSDLFEIEVPPALDPRTREYSESINHFAEVVRAKKQAEAAVAQAQRDLKAAKKAVTQVVDQACE